jgi:hypothetical protein
LPRWLCEGLENWMLKCGKVPFQAPRLHVEVAYLSKQNIFCI